MPELLAIDPRGCGCTECLIGEYRPLQDATEEEIQALFLGELRDHTDNLWLITQKDPFEGDGFVVYEYGRRIDLPRIVLPIPVENYQLDARKDVIEAIYRGDAYIGD